MTKVTEQDQKGATGNDPLANFPGHVPDRSRFEGTYIRKDFAEFLTRLEPRVVEQTGTGRWESTTRSRPGEATEHGTRMKLLERERERLAETEAGIQR